MKIEYICDKCDSDNISRDAWANWDTSTQEWVLGAVFDYAHCHDCDAEARLVERPFANRSA